MRKLIFLFLACLSVMTVHAKADTWGTAFGNGYAEHTIRDGDGNRLIAMCNISIDVKESHHMILLMGNKKYSTLDIKQSLGFQIDKGKKVFPSNAMNWQEGKNNWDTFMEDLSKASEITVFSKNKKLATFNIERYKHTLSPVRQDNRLSEMARCTYQADKYRYGTPRYKRAMELNSLSR